MEWDGKLQRSVGHLFVFQGPNSRTTYKDTFLKRRIPWKASLDKQRER